MKSFPCILFKFVMHATSDQFSDKLNNDWKKLKRTHETLFKLSRPQGQIIDVKCEKLQ